jgi:hypothetical protein
MISPNVVPQQHASLSNPGLHPSHVEDSDHFSKDGRGTKAIEEIPIIGFFRSAMHAKNGDRDRALRAAAKCSSSTIHAGTMLALNLATGGLGIVPTLALGAVAGGVGYASEMALKQRIEVRLGMIVTDAF